MAGEWTGMAIAEAYVLTGELHACGDDFRTAFARHEQRLMPFLRRKQASAATFASSFAPKTSWINLPGRGDETDASAIDRGTFHWSSAPG